MTELLVCQLYLMLSALPQYRAKEDAKISQAANSTCNLDPPWTGKIAKLEHLITHTKLVAAKDNIPCDGCYE